MYRSPVLGTPQTQLSSGLTTPRDASLKEMTDEEGWEKGGVCASNRGAHAHVYSCFQA